MTLALRGLCVVGLALTMSACQAAQSEDAPEATEAPTTGLQVRRPEPTGPVRGQLLVMLTAEAIAAIEAASRTREAGAPELATGLDSLDALLVQFGVTSIEQVFPHAQDPEVIREKFPERARRAPPGATAPDLTRTYLLTFEGEQSVSEAVTAFRADPHIEWAEPNQIVTIQTPAVP